MTRGAIILCGGESSRMGRDKAMLPFGPGEVMLQRVARLVGEAVPIDRIVCVAAPGQTLPQLAAAIQFVFDPIPHSGPLAGLATGMVAIESRAAAVFTTGCDVPLLVPAFIERMFDLLDDDEIAAPHDGQRWHPLAAVYRTNVLPRIDSLLAAGERSLVALLESSRTRRVPIDDLRDVDPQLASLTACNTPDDYRNALRRASATTPE